MHRWVWWTFLTATSSGPWRGFFLSNHPSNDGQIVDDIWIVRRTLLKIFSIQSFLLLHLSKTCFLILSILFWLLRLPKSANKLFANKFKLLVLWNRINTGPLIFDDGKRKKMKSKWKRKKSGKDDQKNEKIRNVTMIHNSYHFTRIQKKLFFYKTILL